MQRLRQAGKRQAEGGRRQSAVRVLGPWLLVLCPLLASCAGDKNKVNSGDTKSSDPLLGAVPAKPPTPGGLPPPSGVPPAQPVSQPKPPGSAAANPPQPAPSTSPSTASLASGNPPRYDMDNSLRISGSPGPAPVPSNAGSWQNPDTVGARLTRGVEPDPAPRGTGFFGGGGSKISSFEQAQSQLNQRGVNWQRLETWGDKGEWKFTCSIPNKQNKFISRTYEARGRDSLAAVRAVVDQIDKEQR